jgi:putative transposase
VSDITYIHSEEGYMYLALVTDTYSRKIVGYDMSDSLEAEGCIRALKMAQKQLPKGKKAIHHSDRGIQYCCKAYIKQLKKKKQRISMTQNGNCYDNAMAERMNGILKTEYMLGLKFKTKPQAKMACVQAIKLYNEERPHYALGMETPNVVHAA